MGNTWADNDIPKAIKTKVENMVNEVV